MFALVFVAIVLAFLFVFGQLTKIFDLILLFSLYLIGYSANEVDGYVVAFAGLISYCIFAVIYKLNFLSFFGSIFFYCWLFVILGMFAPKIEKKLKEMKE